MLEIRPANTLTVPSFASRTVNLDVDLGALAIRYVFSTTITDSDPGNGKLRLSATQQDAALTIRADTLDVNGVDVSGILDAFDDSTSATKGSLRIYKVSDPTKWLVFDVTALASPAGYRNITVSNVAASETSPFDDGDTILLSFQPTGERGQVGPAGSGSTYDTIALAEGASIDAGIDGLTTLGHTAAGDGGGALYKRVALEPSHPGKFQSADGAWWEIADRVLNARSFGAIPPADWDALDGGDKRGATRLAAGAALGASLDALWAAAKALNRDMYFPAGRYEISGQRNMPFRQETVSSLLDCGGISILADGPSTVFATNSSNGADVFQLNGMDNFGIRGFPLVEAIVGNEKAIFTGEISGTTLTVTAISSGSLDVADVIFGAGVSGGTLITALGTGTGGVGTYTINNSQTVASTAMNAGVAGSNGVSITNGFDRLHIEVICRNLPSLDKSNYGDGGKAATVQPFTTDQKCGTLTGTIYADGCLYGFGADFILETVGANNQSIDITLYAENCYDAVNIGCPSALEALPSGIDMGVKVRGSAINCQKDFVASRVYGVDVDLLVATSKSQAERRVSPYGEIWVAADDTIEAGFIQCVHNSRIRLRGDKGSCRYISRLGSAGDDAGGLAGGGTTYECDIFIDVDGTPDNDWVAPLGSVEYVRDSRLFVSSRTTTNPLSSVFYTDGNVVAHGPEWSISDLTVGSISAPFATFSGTKNEMALDTHGDNAGAVSAGKAIGTLYKDTTGIVRVVI